MGLRIGTPDAEATITTRSARLDLESRVGGRRFPSGDRRPACWVAPGVGDRPAFTGPCHPLVAAVPDPRGQPVGRARCEAARRLPVRRGGPQVPDLGHRQPPRVQAGTDRGQKDPELEKMDYLVEGVLGATS